MLIRRIFYTFEQQETKSSGQDEVTTSEKGADKQPWTRKGVLKKEEVFWLFILSLITSREHTQSFVRALRYEIKCQKMFKTEVYYNVSTITIVSYNSKLLPPFTVSLREGTIETKQI